MVSILDPFLNAYREVPLDIAQQFVDQLGEVQAKIDEINSNQ